MTSDFGRSHDEHARAFDAANTRAARCVTHHHACDCREAAHGEEIRDLKARIQRLVDGAETTKAELDRVRNERRLVVASYAEQVDKLEERIRTLEAEIVAWRRELEAEHGTAREMVAAMRAREDARAATGKIGGVA